MTEWEQDKKNYLRDPALFAQFYHLCIINTKEIFNSKSNSYCQHCQYIRGSVFYIFWIFYQPLSNYYWHVLSVLRCGWWLIFFYAVSKCISWMNLYIRFCLLICCSPLLPWKEVNTETDWCFLWHVKKTIMHIALHMHCIPSLQSPQVETLYWHVTLRTHTHLPYSNH